MIGILGDENVKQVIVQMGLDNETLVLTGKKTTRVMSGKVGGMTYAYAIPFREERPLDPVRETEALFKRGCDTFISFHIGTTIKDTKTPGNVFLPSDYVDFDSGPFPDAGYPKDIAMKDPFCVNLRASIGAIAHKIEGKLLDGGTVACLKGPFRPTEIETKLLGAVGGETVARNAGIYARIASARGVCYQPVVLLRDEEVDPIERDTLATLLDAEAEIPHPHSWVRPRLWNLIQSLTLSMSPDFYCEEHDVHPKYLA